ncbi:MAG: Mur ligase family protein [Alphaproteobacteria bacterium]|nr:Mur ligase family protein [Alphaproteobacteria bacterium]MCL2505931.1 Mur ligase family protein [Alphaproteobacteria bacterium]
MTVIGKYLKAITKLADVNSLITAMSFAGESAEYSGARELEAESGVYYKRPLWRAQEVIQAVGGESLHEQSWIVNRVVVDANLVQSGDLFIDIQDKQKTKNKNAALAFERGAVCAVVSEKPKGVPFGAPLIFVKDTNAALSNLAKAARERMKGTVVAITGSVGKSSVKDMLEVMLGAVGNVYTDAYGTGSLLHHYLGLANMPSETNYGVFEISLNECDSISDMAKVVKPDIAVINSIGFAHIGGIEQIKTQPCTNVNEGRQVLQAIARVKAGIFESLPENGVLILNRDMPMSLYIADMAKSRNIKNIFTFSSYVTADVMLRALAMHPEFTDIGMLVDGKKIDCTVSAPGISQIPNSMCAMLVSYIVSGCLHECAAALEHYRPKAGFGVAAKIPLGGNESFILIDQTNEAGVDSFCSAIDDLNRIERKAEERKILVLHDIPELGVSSPDLHISLRSFIVESDIDKVFCCGENVRYLYDALPAGFRGGFAENQSELIELLTGQMQNNDLVMVKGKDALSNIDTVSLLRAKYVEYGVGGMENGKWKIVYPIPYFIPHILYFRWKR